MTVFHAINNKANRYAICYGERLEKSEANYVYLICDGEYVKIGRANNIKKRIDALQTSNARELFVIDYIECRTRAHAKAFETCLHETFARERVRGEWFDLLDNSYFYDFVSSIPSHFYNKYSGIVKKRSGYNLRRRVRDWYEI